MGAGACHGEQGRKMLSWPFGSYAPVGRTDETTQTDGPTGEKPASTVKEASETQSQGPVARMDLPE